MLVKPVTGSHKAPYISLYNTSDAWAVGLLHRPKPVTNLTEIKLSQKSVTKTHV